jgi:hypothetical protein
MKASPVDLSFIISGGGAVKELPHPFPYIEKTILITKIQLNTYICNVGSYICISMIII